MSTPPPNPALLDMIRGAVDDDATADATTKLNELLRTSPEARAAYLDYLELHAILGWERSNEDTQPNETDAPESYPIYRKGCEPKPRRFRAHHFAIAAALLAACGLAVYLLTGSTDPQPTAPEYHPPITTLVASSGPAVYIDDAIANEGNEYPAGRIVTQGGVAEFQLRGGTNVRLHGASRLQVRSRTSAALSEGSAEFNCPAGVVGYTVHLPSGARVVDLGTAFTMTSGPALGESVHVTEGLVELHDGDRVIALPARHAARYVDHAWQIIDLTAQGVAEHTANVHELAFTPKSVAAGQLEDSERLFLLRERTDVRLDEPLLVAIRRPGEFGFDKLSSGPIEAGTTLDSYLLHFDAVGDDKDSARTIEASVTFDRPVLGLIVKAGINNNDALFAHPDAEYVEDKTRGIEKEDTVTLSQDRRTVSVRLTGWRPDQLRVFVRSEPTQEKSPVPSPEGDPQ